MLLCPNNVISNANEESVEFFQLPLARRNVLVASKRVRYRVQVFGSGIGERAAAFSDACLAKS
jgi:hypothetical protein